MTECKNATFRRPADMGILPVWDSESKILMVGSITSIDGMKKGFYYASQTNQLWRLVDYCINSNEFLELKNKLLENYKLFEQNKQDQDSFEHNKLIIKNEFKASLHKYNIALCDIFTECYFKNNSSLDGDIILNSNNYPFKTSKDIIQHIVDNSKIKVVIVNSSKVEEWFNKLGIKGNYKLIKVVSPSPARRVKLEIKQSEWKDAFNKAFSEINK